MARSLYSLHIDGHSQSLTILFFYERSIKRRAGDADSLPNEGRLFERNQPRRWDSELCPAPSSQQSCLKAWRASHGGAVKRLVIYPTCWLTLCSAFEEDSFPASWPKDSAKVLWFVSAFVWADSDFSESKNSQAIHWKSFRFMIFFPELHASHDLKTFLLCLKAGREEKIIDDQPCQHKRSWKEVRW